MDLVEKMRNVPFRLNQKKKKTKIFMGSLLTKKNTNIKYKKSNQGHSTPLPSLTLIHTQNNRKMGDTHNEQNLTG